MSSVCIHPDTQVLLFFGGMKAVKSLIRGDILIGDDKQPRIVMNISMGGDTMFKIAPEKNDTFIISASHLLNLYNEFTEEYVHISVHDYIVKNDTWRSKHSIYLTPIEYASQTITNDPYLIGVLLLSKSNNVDDIMKDYLNKKLDSLSKFVTSKLQRSALKVDMIDRNEIEYLLNFRYIPDAYMYNTREVRLKLLRGVIDIYERTPGSSKRSKSVETPHSSSLLRSTRSSSAKSVGSRRSSSQPHSSTNRSTRQQQLKIKKLPEFVSGMKAHTTKSPITYTTKSPAHTQPIRQTKSPITHQPKSPAHTQPIRQTKSPITHQPKSPAHTQPIRQTKSPNRLSKHKTTNRSPPPKSNHPRRRSLTPKIITASQKQKPKKKLPSIKINISDIKLFIKDFILLEQLKFLARSIGFVSYNIMNELHIIGNINEVPVINMKQMSKFELHPYDENDYISITTDGNNRFLLANCLVV